MKNFFNKYCIVGILGVFILSFSYASYKYSSDSGNLIEKDKVFNLSAVEFEEVYSVNTSDFVQNHGDCHVKTQLKVNNDVYPHLNNKVSHVHRYARFPQRKQY